MALLVVLCFFALLILWALLWRRLDEIESRLNREAKSSRLEEEISTLTRRVYRLENSRLQEAPATQERLVSPVPERIEEIPALPLKSEAAVPEQRQESQHEPVAVPVSTEAFKPAAFQKEEWEALVGGNILNKLGALVLVFGLALFLAYSFTYMGPSGRAATSALLSAALLVSGIQVERRPRFRTFAYGLIGAGWAGLYATAYAIYALPAARVLHDPFLGSLILLATGCAMVLHSLRYKVQAIASVAFFTPFAALAAMPNTPFALISLVPLAAALLYLSWRFSWYRMALFGMAATWGTCIVHSSAHASLTASESLLLIYWLLFEAFDLFRTHRKITEPELMLLMPLNAIAFLALSFAAWNAQAPAHLWLGSAMVALLFLGNAQARFNVGGQFEPSLTLAAAFGGLSILGRAEGLWASAELAAEAELLFLAGWRFRFAFVRGLGLAGFVISLIDVGAGIGMNTTLLPGIVVHRTTAPLLLHSFLFYVNRKIWKSAWYFSSAAALSLCIVLLSEVPDDYVGLGFAVFALILFEIGQRKNLLEFRLQFYCVAFFALVGLVSLYPNNLHHGAPIAVWISSLIAALASWWVTVRTWNAAQTPNKKFSGTRDISAGIGAALALAAFSMMLPDTLLALSSLALGIAFIEFDMALNVYSFSLVGIAITFIASTELYGTDFSRGSKAIWLYTGVPFLAGLYFIWIRWKRAGAALLRLIVSLLALLLLTVIVYVEVPESYQTVAWAIEGVGLLAAGLSLRERALRLEGLFLLLACILKLFFYDLRNLETIYRILSFIALGLILLGVSWTYTRFRERLRHYL